MVITENMPRDLFAKSIPLVHKANIAVAIADAGRHSEVRSFGVIANETRALDQLVRNLRDRDASFGSVMKPGRAVMGFIDMTDAAHGCTVVSAALGGDQSSSPGS